jgi:hypothetical protein
MKRGHGAPFLFEKNEQTIAVVKILSIFAPTITDFHECNTGRSANNWTPHRGDRVHYYLHLHAIMEVKSGL